MKEIEIEEIDEYQNAMQRTEEDDEYFNSSSSITESSLQSTNKSDSALIIFNDKFKCCFKNCKNDYFDEECEECKNHGEENKLFCLDHKDHSYHLEKNKNSNEEIDFVVKNKTDDNEDLDISLCIGNANQQYIFNLLKCITEVRL